MALTEDKIKDPSKLQKGDLLKATNSQLIELLDVAKDKDHIPAAILGIIQAKTMKMQRIFFYIVGLSNVILIISNIWLMIKN